MKTFLLMLGSAVCGVLLFIVAVYGYFYWQYSRVGPGVSVPFPPRNETTVATAPPIVDQPRFHGTSAMTSGDFSMKMRKTVLASGPGGIVGNVTSDGKPLEGLRLRLALNGAVMSQWATTGADGRYEVALPYGKYRVDGYELDTFIANTVLAGKTDGPRQSSWYGDETDVQQGRPGAGLDLAYVDPVVKVGPRGEVKSGEPVVLSWKPYPGATAYRVQLTEQKDPRDYENQRQLFEWRDRPVVEGTRFDLKAHKVALQKGHYYHFEVEALGELKRTLSQSTREFGRMDFRVVE